jgi:disulfide oxidoreductase YuzD
MLVFIDESGIHKKVDHSSFVLVFINLTNQVLINNQIEAIEKELKIKPFHWADFGSKAGWSIRKEFIKQVSTLPFTLKYIIVNNPIKPQKMLQQALNLLLEERIIYQVIIDGRQPRWYAEQIKLSLRMNGISVKKLRIANDQAFPALRLADALAGLIRSYYDGSRFAQELYELIRVKNKITDHLKVDGQAHR